MQIHYNFPPVRAVGAIRNYEFARALARENEVFVISRSNRIGGQDLKEKENFKLHIANCLDYNTFRNPEKTGGIAPPTADKLQSKLKKMFKRLALTFPFLLVLDRGGIIYIVHAYLIARRLVRQHDIDVVYSSYQPYADHIIAFLIKKTFPTIRWIADMRDQPIDLYRKNVLWPRWQMWYNQILLKRANALTTVSKGVKKQLQRYHTDISVINNGIDPERLAKQSLSLPAKFRITYTGALYQGQRDPTLLLEALSTLEKRGKMKLEDLEIVYAGPDANTWNTFFAPYPNLLPHQVNLGLVSRKEALMLQKNTVLNVLLTWANPQTRGILTGKLYEYFASGRPVLAMISGIMDEELVELIEPTKIGIVVASETEEASARLQGFLSRLYDEWRAGKTSGFGLRTGQLTQLYWPDLAQKLFQIMRKTSS